ncbi:hypothetical protein B0H34DRAFT_787095 [Crassisporium funariophilum]|nr:hypothetical protein B0H34DRAFT_787095 [Crassisporium funariophilum]
MYPPSESSTSTRQKKIPSWLPVSAFIGTSLALAIPLVMLRRQRGGALRTALKESSAPPPRRGAVGAAGPMRGSGSSTVSTSAQETVVESSDSSSPGVGELMSAIGRMDFSTAFMAGKAFAIATGLVAVGGFGLTWAVKVTMGVQDAREFGQKMRSVFWTTVPGLTSRIHRGPETDEERREMHQVAPFGVQEDWRWEDAEKRMKKAYDEGGFPLWAQTAMREVEAEARVERTRREREHEESLGRGSTTS